MRFVYVLEDDAKFQTEIVDAIQSIDPKIQIRLLSLENFFLWMKDLMQKGAEAIPEAGVAPHWIPPLSLSKEAHRLVAVVAKIEYLGVRQLPLLKRTRSLFVKKGICTEADPTAFVLTTFDEPTFSVKEIKDRIISNVIYKPFDRLILIQHLTYAIDGRHPPSKYVIANQKTSATIEMLKEAKMEALSEVGFITRSQRHLPLTGMVSKYYGASFAAGNKNSLMAKLLESKPDPLKKGEYICLFGFFGVLPPQISMLRRKIRSSIPDMKFLWQEPDGQNKIKERHLGVIIIEDVKSNAEDIKETLEHRFSKVNVAIYKNSHDFLLDLDPGLIDLEQIQPKYPAFPEGQSITFVFDKSGMHVVSLIKLSSERTTLFGLSEAQVTVSSFWMDCLGTDGISLWKNWLATHSDHVVVVSISENKYYLRPLFVKKDENTQSILVEFQELTAEQRNVYLLSHSRIPKKTDIIFVSHRFLKPDDQEHWLKVQGAIMARSQGVGLGHHCRIISVASKDYSDIDLRKLGAFVHDVMYRPIDRKYLAQKVKFFYSEMETRKEPVDFPTQKKDETIDVANPVTISEISEAGLVLKYYRPIELGEFCYFILWSPYEIGAPRMTATCNYTEPSSEKGSFNNHFVFFGIVDYFLKSLRIWIRDNYISSRDGGKDH